MDIKKYLRSSDFENLCEALDFLESDIDQIKKKITDLDDDNSEESIAVIIYDQLLKYDEAPDKEIIDKTRYYRWLSDDESLNREELLYQVYINDKSKWEDIKNKMEAGIASGKINSDYLFEKEYNQELDRIVLSESKRALDIIYLHEIHYLLNKYNINYDVKKAVFKDACITGYYANPLMFGDVKREVEKAVELFLKGPSMEIKDFSSDSLWVSYMLISDSKLVPFIDKYISRFDDEYSDDSSECLFTFPYYFNTEMAFFVITASTSSDYKLRFDFSNNFIIKKELIENSKGILVNQSSELAQYFEDYVDENFRNSHNLELKEENTVEYDGFKVTLFTNPEDGKTWHIFDVINKEEYVDCTHEEIPHQKPLSEEFLGLISSLNFDIDYAYEIREMAEDSDDVLFMINKRILENKNYTRNILSKEDLLNQFAELHIKTILLCKENFWDDFREKLISKIDAGEIKSSYDLQFEFGQIARPNLKVNILNAQIEALLDFKELDSSYAKDMAFYLKGKDIYDNGLAEYVNDLIKEDVEVKQKEYLDEGKYAAPRGLVYPELSAYTIGWRMGYGEDYAMNEPWHTKEFYELFPKPQNWLFDPRKSDFEKLTVLCYLWRDDGKPKYSSVSDDAVEVNDFITLEQRDGEFRYDAKRFKSIEHAVLTAKYSLFDKIDYYETTLNTLKRGFELTDDETAYWDKLKYTVLLNASYYKIMQDDMLKEKLLSTGDKSLVYVSDDEWGGSENLFGFALMELRDEIKRLCENEHLIDWEYTEYLKHKNPYEKTKKRNPDDEQSPEYMIVSSILSDCEVYARDCNLSDGLAEKYEIGQVLNERAFVDATDKIGGMVTTHRYLILSNQMSDLSEFEKDTDWGLHTAGRDSRFKVLDIFSRDEKTVILLLQIPEGFESAFEESNRLIDEIIEDSREMADEFFDDEPIPEVSGSDWLERVSFPIGMDDEGNFYE